MSTKKQGDIITSDIRESLKRTFQKEVDSLPKLIGDLEPMDRVKVLIKLMPYVLPTVKSVHHKEDEPLNTRF